MPKTEKEKRCNLYKNHNAIKNLFCFNVDSGNIE